MGRSISAKPVYAASGAPLVAIKWRIHDKGPQRAFPAMTLSLPAQSAAELRDALSEALDQINAVPSAKMDVSDGRQQT